MKTLLRLQNNINGYVEEIFLEFRIGVVSLWTGSVALLRACGHEHQGVLSYLLRDRTYPEVSVGLTQSHRLTLQQQHEVLLVVASFRIFPVHVQTVELTVPQERDGAVYERLASVPGCGHHLELLGAEGPPTCKDMRRYILESVRKLWGCGSYQRVVGLIRGRFTVLVTAASARRQ